MFIAFEGIEGVGKSTLLKYAAEILIQHNIPVLLTREPGGTQIGEEIRDILLKHRHEKVSSVSELLLMFAARVQHIETVIQPALNSDNWVLCDRFTDASYGYQGGGRSISYDVIHSLEKLTLGNFKPDKVFLLDAPLEIGFKRVKERGNPHDRFEQEKMDFFERVRNAYLERAKIDPDRYLIIDASRPLEEVKSVVLNAMQKLLETC